MKWIKPLSILLGLEAAFFMFAARADEAEPHFPAAEVARSIVRGEESVEKEEEEEFLRAPVSWDPYAMPEASRSWLLLGVPEQVLEKLQKNEDQNGNVLF